MKRPRPSEGDSVTPLFRNLNLKHVPQILVLNAPATFETELSALSGVEIVTDADETEQVAFVRAFVMTQVEANAVATTVAKKILGDGVVWCGVVCLPQSEFKAASLRFQSRLRSASAWRPGIRGGAPGCDRQRLVRTQVSTSRVCSNDVSRHDPCHDSAGKGARFR